MIDKSIIIERLWFNIVLTGLVVQLKDLNCGPSNSFGINYGFSTFTVSDVTKVGIPRKCWLDITKYRFNNMYHTLINSKLYRLWSIYVQETVNILLLLWVSQLRIQSHAFRSAFQWFNVVWWISSSHTIFYCISLFPFFSLTQHHLIKPFMLLLG